MEFDKFLGVAEEFSDKIYQWDDRIQILYEINADALIAGSMILYVLNKLQRPAILSNIKQITPEIKTARKDYLWIIIGDIDYEINNAIYISTLNIKDKFVLNPINFGYKYEDASYSACAYFACSALIEELDYIIQLPLISFHTYKMMGEYSGLHKIIAEDAEQGGVIKIFKSFSILGSDQFKISDALINSLSPFLPGLTGNTKRVIEILTKAGIEEETSAGERTLSELDKDEIKQLNSKLVVHLALHKGYQEDELVLIKSKTKFLNESSPILSNTWDFATAVNDAIHREKLSAAIAVLIGERGDYMRYLSRLYTEERKAVASSFQLILEHREDIQELQTFRYYIADKKISWYNASYTAAIGLSNGLVEPNVPFAVIAPGPNDLFTIGIRASKMHSVGEGLSRLIQKIIDDRGLSSKVEGSKFSASVSIPKDSIENILLDLNDRLKEEL